MSIYRLLISLSLFTLIACGDEPEKVAEVKVTASKTLAKTPIKPNLPIVKAATKVKKLDPLEGKSLSEICSSNSLSLIKWSFEELQSNFASLCCKEGGLDPNNSMSCELDWPFSDVPACSEYDLMRNEIYARYGREFKSDKWKKAFGARSWYKIRADYSDDEVSAVAQKNVTHLLKRKKDKVSCMD